MRSKTAKAILKNVKKTYSEIAEDFSGTRKTNWAEFETILPYISDGDKVADIGCGNGRFYKFISSKKKVTYIGIDNNSPLLTEAKRLNKANFKEGDLLKIPLPPETQNITVCIAALHHIPSKKLREKAVKELARITKDKGVAAITVWNLLEQKKYKKQVVKAFFKWLYSLGKYEKRGLFIPWGNEKKPRYYYAFKEKEIESLLNPYFKIIKKEKGKNLLLICEKL
jgi:ubiquinone/menaquinone biosynthesis C-methylase UbiE